MSPFNVFRRTVSGTRKTAGGWIEGEWVEPSEDPITIRASVQPASQEDVQLLPEGRRLTGAYKLFTNDTLQVAIEGDNSQFPDVIHLPHGDYEVLAQAPWQNGIISHNEYIVSRRLND